MLILHRKLETISGWFLLPTNNYILQVIWKQTNIHQQTTFVPKITRSLNSMSHLSVIQIKSPSSHNTFADIGQYFFLLTFPYMHIVKCAKMRVAVIATCKQCAIPITIDEAGNPVFVCMCLRICLNVKEY